MCRRNTRVTSAKSEEDGRNRHVDHVQGRIHLHGTAQLHLHDPAEDGAKDDRNHIQTRPLQGQPAGQLY